MGSFFDNIHIRTENRTGVERAWQAYWDSRGENSWAWVSPFYHHWVTVYDWRCDQQDVNVLTDLSTYISKALGAVVLSFQLQDSDLAEYWLINEGELRDHYTSNRQYFASYAESATVTPETGVYSGYGPDVKKGNPFEEDLSDGGNTELLRMLTKTAASDAELEAILRTPAEIADDILTALASALGMNDIWASLGYYYLATEGETIIGFDQFNHLPPLQPPQTRRFAGQ